MRTISFPDLATFGLAAADDKSRIILEHLVGPWPGNPDARVLNMLIFDGVHLERVRKNIFGLRTFSALGEKER
jgi:hypothetical protein